MPSPTTLFSDVKALIEATRQRVALSINAELTQLYWQIGTRINIELHQRGGVEYGQQTVRGLAQQLEGEYGRSYAEKSLRRMMQVAEPTIIATLWRQLSWSHFKLLMVIAEPLKRDFYTQLATLHHWSVRELTRQLDAQLYERTVIIRKSEGTIAQELAALRDSGQLSPNLVFKDSYVLDFLGLAGAHSEATLEQAIVGRMQEFILEMGQGFSFLERQKCISVDNTDYYLDLLFYHRRLRRLVA